MHALSVLSMKDPDRTSPIVSVTNRATALFRKLELPLLPFYTRSYVCETYAIFATLLFGTYSVLMVSLHPKKSADVILNELVFLGISTAALFFISIPKTLTQPPKNKPFSTDSILYLSTFSVSVAIITLESNRNSNYVFSSDVIATWNSRMWGMFTFNLVILLPFIGLNLRLARRNGELFFHLVGYSFLISLLCLAIFQGMVRVHVHHWISAYILVALSRFSARPSRFFHAVFLGVFIEGIGLYGPDPLFEGLK